ncbi:MAG: hypothetical protein PVJ68_01645 [Candidatus Thiodiazotropha sp.]|jgi:hypothetical protein
MILYKLKYNVIKYLPIYLIVVLVSGEIYADDSTDDSQDNGDEFLLFDDNTPKFDKYSFNIEESERLKPKENDFEMINYSPMSNKAGERWVLVTLRNNSTGQRFLKSEYIVATFASGEQSNPQFADQKVDGGGIVTKTIYFGTNKFPIVLLEN